MCFLLSRFHKYDLCKILIRSLHQNHYDILKLSKNCTDKEIRDAFVKLSKECHPDTSLTNNAQNSVEFSKIMEAYKILSKRRSRAQYDSSLLNTQRAGQSNVYEPWRPNPAEYTSAEKEPYYGINGLNKVSNSKIFWICLLVAAVGGILQAFAISHSITFQRDKLEDASMKSAMKHAAVRAQAEKMGNDQQLEMMREKLKTNMTD